MDEFQKPVMELMQGISDNSWHNPVLIRVRKFPTCQCMQFDVYLYKMSGDPKQEYIKINLPAFVND